MPCTRAIPSLSMQLASDIRLSHCSFHLVPDREDTAGLGETSLLLHTADPLLEDGGDLGRGGLSIGGIAASEGVDDGGRGALLQGEKSS